MKKNSNILAELFSANNTHDSETTEIRKKNQKKSNSTITTYDVVAHTENNQLTILDKKLSNYEIDFIRSQFCQ